MSAPRPADLFADPRPVQTIADLLANVWQRGHVFDRDAPPGEGSFAVRLHRRGIRPARAGRVGLRRDA